VTTPNAAVLWKIRAAFVGLVVWASAMLYLVVTSANPPIVSRPQVLSADALVEGVLELGPSVLLKPDVVLWSRRPVELKDLPADGVLIADKPASWMKSGMRAIAPLEETAPGRFRIKPIPFEVLKPKGPPAPVYPASDVVRKQLEPLAPRKASAP
jgi:hypothetical protein